MSRTTAGRARLHSPPTGRPAGPRTSTPRTSPRTSKSAVNENHGGHALTEDASAAGRALRHAASTSSRSSLTRTFVEAASRTAFA